MKHKGFTLIEFIVIISIFAIMSAVALFNYQGFRSSVSLGNLSRDIALTIRQAQVFGWSTITANDTSGVIQLDPITGNPIRFAEGVFFEKDMITSRYKSQIVLYRKSAAADVATASAYSAGQPPGGDAVVDTIKVQGPNQIALIQTAPDESSLLLGANNLPSGGTPISSDLSIAFSRPNQQAYLFDGGNPIGNGEYVGIYIAANADCPVGGACTKYGHVIIVSRSGTIITK